MLSVCRRFMITALPTLGRVFATDEMTLDQHLFFQRGKILQQF